MCNEIPSLYDKISITIVPSYTGKYHEFVAVRSTSNNAGIVTRASHGNKLVIFSGIAWYYGDTYIVSVEGSILRQRLFTCDCFLTNLQVLS